MNEYLRRVLALTALWALSNVLLGVSAQGLAPLILGLIVLGLTYVASLLFLVVGAEGASRAPMG